MPFAHLRPRRAPGARRRPALLLGAAALAAAGAAALPSAASAAPNIVPGATYTMVPTHTTPSVKFLEVPNASGAAGVGIVQNRISGTTQPHQRFRITQAGTTGGRPYFRIRPTHVSGMCLDVEGASMFNNARVIQFPCVTGNRNQHFFLDAIFPGATIHTVTARHSGLRFDIAGASKGAGAPLQQFADNGGTHQRFLLTRVG
jgi:hypothetical protein